MTKEVEEKVITYLKTHRVILYEDFLKLVDANATSSFFIPTMFRLYRIEVNERAFVQVIEEAHSELSYALLAKKIYSVFMQIPIDLVGDDLKIMSSCLEESFPYFLPDGALKTIKLMA